MVSKISDIELPKLKNALKKPLEDEKNIKGKSNDDLKKDAVIQNDSKIKENINTSDKLNKVEKDIKVNKKDEEDFKKKSLTSEDNINENPKQSKNKDDGFVNNKVIKKELKEEVESFDSNKCVEFKEKNSKVVNEKIKEQNNEYVNKKEINNFSKVKIKKVKNNNKKNVQEKEKEISKKKVSLWIVLIIFVILLIISYFLYLESNHHFDDNNVVDIRSVYVNSYNNNIVELVIEPSTKQVSCAVTFEEISSEQLEFQKLIDGKCVVKIDYEKPFVYFIDSKDRTSDVLRVTDYVIDLNIKEKYYIAPNSKIVLGDNRLVVGNPDIRWIISEGIVSIEEDIVTGIKNGFTTINAMVGDLIVAQTNVYVTDTIVEMPNEFNSSKPFLECERFNNDEAKLLDEILEYRISEAGYGTRAGAVAAARFLTLEFPYRISYYWESGRLNNTGKHYVDGEGRYYHKGLYLDKSKYESIEASLFGPAMWGCKLRCYEDDPPNFIPGGKYPNGLDCSGFVTWSLYNGGFDIGDRGAGESPSPGQLTDLGEFKSLTKNLIESGKIKVGDLFNFWGHISILIGQDANNFYIAESLNNYKGVVVKTYSKKTVMNTFKYVVLMDDVYKEDGNLTDMWY